MRCALKNVLLLCFFSSTIGLASAVNCAPADKDGTPLTGSKDSGAFVTCTYSGAGACTYFPADGSFSSGSSQCPKGLPQGAGGGGSNPTTSQAPPPPPPATTTTPSPPPPPPPPVTTSTPPPPATTPPAPVTSAIDTTTAPTDPATSSTSSTPTTFITVTSPSPSSTSTTTTAAPSSSPSNAALPLTRAGTGGLAVMGLAGIVAAINLL